MLIFLNSSSEFEPQNIHRPRKSPLHRKTHHLIHSKAPLHDSNPSLDKTLHFMYEGFPACSPSSNTHPRIRD